MRPLCVPVSVKKRVQRKGERKKKRHPPLMALALKVALTWMALQVDQSRVHARVHPAVL